MSCGRKSEPGWHNNRMDPFARKMILGMLAFGSAMLLFAGALSVVYFHHRPRCGEQVLSQAASPDERWTAVVMQRRCGDESPFFIHVNLLPAAESLRLGYFSGRADEGEVFLAEQESPDAAPELEWSSPTQLTIRCSRCRAALVQKRDEHRGPVQVGYQLRP
jgi:hypothetical protein